MTRTTNQQVVVLLHDAGAPSNRVSSPPPHHRPAPRRGLLIITLFDPLAKPLTELLIVDGRAARAGRDDFSNVVVQQRRH